MAIRKIALTCVLNNMKQVKAIFMIVLYITAKDTRVKKSLSYDKMFAVILLVSVISLLLMEAVKIIQYKSMPWEHLKDE